MDRFAESCHAIQSLLTQVRTTFDGDYYQLVDAPCSPKAVQSRLPLLVGGGGERRTLPIAAQYADEWHVWATAAELRRKQQILDAHCLAIGREPRSLQRCTGARVAVLTHPNEAEPWLSNEPDAICGSPVHVVQQIRDYAAAGADEFIARDAAGVPLKALFSSLDLFQSQVAPQLE